MRKTTILIIFLLLFITVNAYGATGYTNISNIAIYNSDSYDSKVTDTLKMSSRVEILEEKGEWCKIKTEDGTIGWTEKHFITIPSEKYVVNNTDYNVNIRTSPTTGSKQVGQLPSGAKAKYVDTYHSWHIIEYMNEEYYIASWLTDIEYKEKEQIYLLYDSTNIRISPSLNSEIVAQGNKYEAFEVLTEENGWFKILLKDGKQGYVAGWLITHDMDSYSEDLTSYKKTTDSLNLRTEPTAGSDRILTLNKGQLIKTLKTENGWDKIVSEDGYIGWCNSDYLNETLPLEGKVILLDAGHGGRDPGAISYSGRYEKHVNLEVAYNLKDILNRLGASVYMTRTGDSYINNTERGRMADRIGADILLSIHHNSLNNNNYFGLSTYYNTIKYKDPSYGYNLAEAIYLNAITVNGVYRDGILDRNFEVLRETNTPAALIEIGFMSNPMEEMNIHNSSFQNTMTSKIADGIIDYFNNN